MDFCPAATNLSAGLCILGASFNLLPPISAVIAAVSVVRAPSKIDKLKATAEFSTDQGLIQRSFRRNALKQSTAYVLAFFSLVLGAINFYSSTASVVDLIGQSLQAATFVSLATLHSIEYKKQGTTSNPLIGTVLVTIISSLSQLAIFKSFHFSFSSGTFWVNCAIIIISLVYSCGLILRSSDYTESAEKLQSEVSLTNPLINANDVLGEQQVQSRTAGRNVKPSDEEDGIICDSRMGSTAAGSAFASMQQDSNQSIFDEVFSRSSSFISVTSNDEGLDINENTFEEARKEVERTRRASTNESLRNLELKNSLPSDIKVVGYKLVKEQQLFVIQYRKPDANKTVVQTYRTHKEFKILQKRLEEELISSSLSLPLLPKRIKQTTTLDQSVLQEKKVKYNRFLFYIEFNSIVSEAIVEFLKPLPKRDTTKKDTNK